MKNVIEILKNYYKPVYEAKRSRDFFFSLADYVDYIKKTPETNKIIKEIVKDKEAMLKDRDNYETQALQELGVAKKELLKIVKESKVSDPELDEELNELKLYEKGDVQSSLEESDAIGRYLWEIAKILFQKGHKESLKKFIDERPIHPNIYIDHKNFIFSETLRKRQEIDRRIIDLRATKLWGCWDYLSLVPTILLEKKEFPEVVSKRDSDIALIYIELREIFEARNKIWNEMTSLPPQIPPEEAREMLKYKLYASKIHNRLLEELDSQETKEKPIEVIRAVEPYTILPDRTTEIQRQMEESQRWVAERAQKDRQHRELMKQNRMLATKIDKYGHALDLIIERAEFNGDGSSFNIDYYYFNFEDRMVDSKMLEKFLTDLQNNGCFEKYGRTNYSGGTKFGFSKVNIGKLKEFKEKRGGTKATYQNGVLDIQDKKIDFAGKQNQKDLLITLFKDSKKNWYYEEIQGDWDEFSSLNVIKYPEDFWRKFYNAGDEINKAIAIETQIKDFLIKTGIKQIRINEKYL